MAWGSSMNDPALKLVIELLGAAALLLITALASSSGGAEGEGRAAPVRLWVVLQALAGCSAGALAGAAGHAGGAAGALAGFGGAEAAALGSWALFGALIGAAQWMALRAANRAHALWVPASVLGWLPFAVANTPFTWAATGALAAFFQAVLCRRVVNGPLTWILASAFGWQIAGVAGVGTGMLLAPSLGGPLAWVAGWTVVGLVGGLVTAVAVRPALMPPQP